jgi:tetratricopeptide (TPR) repeat protein
MKASLLRCLCWVVLLLHVPAITYSSSIDVELEGLTRESDVAKYDVPNGDARAKAFEALRVRAVRVATLYPDRAEPLVWQAWALCEKGSALQSFSSFGMYKDARQKLEKAIAIHATVPNIYIAGTYSTLGMLYGVLPGFPLSFGDKDKAREYLLKAVALDPVTPDWNLNYAEFLLNAKDFAGALKYANLALNAPPFPSRDKANAGWHQRAEMIIAAAKAKQR